MEDLNSFIKKHRKNEEKASDFATYLYKLMNKYGFKNDPDLYNKANISKQSFSLIRSGKVNPTVETVIKIVFALHATNNECKYLLKKAGFTLASSSNYALIIRYCIENQIYDLYELNKYLKEYGYKEID